jgi:hypothetical protein
MESESMPARVSFASIAAGFTVPERVLLFCHLAAGDLCREIRMR